jgi:hypothetical protein
MPPRPCQPASLCPPLPTPKTKPTTIQPSSSARSNPPANPDPKSHHNTQHTCNATTLTPLQRPFTPSRNAPIIQQSQPTSTNRAPRSATSRLSTQTTTSCHRCTRPEPTRNYAGLGRCAPRPERESMEAVGMEGDPGGELAFLADLLPAAAAAAKGGTRGCSVYGAMWASRERISMPTQTAASKAFDPRRKYTYASLGMSYSIPKPQPPSYNSHSSKLTSSIRTASKQTKPTSTSLDHPQSERIKRPNQCKKTRKSRGSHPRSQRSSPSFSAFPVFKRITKPLSTKGQDKDVIAPCAADEIRGIVTHTAIALPSSFFFYTLLSLLVGFIDLFLVCMILEKWSNPGEGIKVF